MIIEICPHEPRASACLDNGAEISSDATIASDLADCRASGDCEPACRYVLAEHKPEFRIVARNAAGDYENRLATDDELRATTRALYYDEFPAHFDDVERCKVYLIWEAASELEQ